MLQEVHPWRGLANRVHIHQYAKIELELMDGFIKAKSANSFSNTVELEGFVSRVGGREFLLRSCLSSVDGVLCDASGVRSLPTEYEFVRVKGTRINLPPRIKEEYSHKQSSNSLCGHVF